MDAFCKSTIYDLLILICKLWIWDTREKIPSEKWSTWFVYPNHIPFQDARLPAKKRIVISFQIQDDIR